MLMPGFIILIAVAIMAWALFNKSQTFNKTSNLATQNDSLNSDTITKIFLRTEVISLLEQLNTHNPPDKLNPGAMCYAPRRVSENANYICPSCGEKTLYTGEYVNTIEFEIPKCRNLMNLLPKEQFIFNESSFCKKCMPNAEMKELCLTINFQDNQNSTTCSISSNDIKLINEFLNGKLVHKTSNDSEVELKRFLDRLEILFGLKK